jgi:hypothetical protein
MVAAVFALQETDRGTGILGAIAILITFGTAIWTAWFRRFGQAFWGSFERSIGPVTTAA